MSPALPPVSRLCLGTATFGARPSPSDAVALVHRAIDLGITFVDTADSYGDQPRFDRPGAPPAADRPSAEAVLGRALAGRRDSVAIASKVCEPVDTGRGLGRAHMEGQLAQSLWRLRTSYLDLYLAHHPDPETPFADMAATFDRLVRAGDIRAWGLSNFSAEQVASVLAVCAAENLTPPVCVQTPWSLARRSAEVALVPLCLDQGLGVMAYSPLASGLLAGATSRSRREAGSARFGGDGSWAAADLAVADRMEKLADSWELRPDQVALAWLLHQRGLTSVVIGAERPASLDSAAAAAALRLSHDQLADLSASVAPAAAGGGGGTSGAPQQ